MKTIDGVDEEENAAAAADADVTGAFLKLLRVLSSGAFWFCRFRDERTRLSNGQSTKNMNAERVDSLSCLFLASRVAMIIDGARF